VLQVIRCNVLDDRISNISSQDVANNIVTFETNHFSMWRLAVNPVPYSNDTYIFTIPGLNIHTFISEVLPSHPEWDFRDAYLQDAIVQTRLSEITGHGRDNYLFSL